MDYRITHVRLSSASDTPETARFTLNLNQADAVARAEAQTERANLEESVVKEPTASPQSAAPAPPTMVTHNKRKISGNFTSAVASAGMPVDDENALTFYQIIG